VNVCLLFQNMVAMTTLWPLQSLFSVSEFRPKQYPLNTNSEGSLPRTEIMTSFIAILAYFA